VPDPKKPTAIDQMVEILRSLVTEPVTDQSSMKPTPEDVKRVKRALATPKARKPAAKPRPKPATKKKRAATRRKTVSRKKSTARTAKRRKTARK
jgi:hypothetical protein